VLYKGLSLPHDVKSCRGWLSVDSATKCFGIGTQLMQSTYRWPFWQLNIHLLTSNLESARLHMLSIRDLLRRELISNRLTVGMVVLLLAGNKINIRLSSVSYYLSHSSFYHPFTRFTYSYCSPKTLPKCSYCWKLQHTQHGVIIMEP
jgi:hypothetical protein